MNRELQRRINGENTRREWAVRVFLWLVIKRRWTGGLGRTMGQKMGGIFKKRADYIMSPLRGCGYGGKHVFLYNYITPTGFWMPCADDASTIMAPLRGYGYGGKHVFLYNYMTPTWSFV